MSVNNNSDLALFTMLIILTRAAKNIPLHNLNFSKLHTCLQLLLSIYEKLLAW